MQRTSDGGSVTEWEVEREHATVIRQKLVSCARLENING